MGRPLNEYFTRHLLRWHATTNRLLPWKGIRNPYLIWLSEIILQQTRAEQAIPYYEKLTQRFPTVTDLAQASEDELMKLWQGLGYYARARHLHVTAKAIVERFNGIFPSRYEDILSLKGIGPYTAAAIASFAFEQPYPVVDGNVYRVIARFFGIDISIDSSEAKRFFYSKAKQLIQYADKPSAYNQAIMDFGALLCKPAQPLCGECPLAKKCRAFIENKTHQLPVRSKKIKIKERFFHYLVITYQKAYLLQKRVNDDIWRGLYEFPMIEARDFLSAAELVQHPLFHQLLLPTSSSDVRWAYRTSQRLSHQIIHATFYEIDTIQPPVFNPSIIAVETKKLHEFAFPKIVDWYFLHKQLYLDSKNCIHSF